MIGTVPNFTGTPDSMRRCIRLLITGGASGTVRRQRQVPTDFPRIRPQAIGKGAMNFVDKPGR